MARGLHRTILVANDLSAMNGLRDCMVHTLEVEELEMSRANKEGLFEVILDSWDRNNRILVNLLRALPNGGLQARVMPDSPSVAEMFTHIHYVRLIFLSEDVPHFTIHLPQREWFAEQSVERITEELNRSAKAVRDAVENCIRSGRQMSVHYDHPLLYVQHMIWHEGYHHGQIKLALKAIGRPFDDEEIGPVTWDIWLDKTRSA
jgi:uncharacterized damage-inducible protein DinB